jgi:transglutaminase-like putative cysteine protease
MIVRLVKWLRPREGWGAFLLLLTTLLCLPAAAMAAEWVPGDEGWVGLVVTALLVGRWLALRGDWGWAVWLPVGAALGLLAALSVAAHVVLFLPGSGEPAYDFAQRWVVWLAAALGGGSSEDPDIFLFYAALLCWGAVLLAAWAFYRRGRPFVALLPPVMLGAVSVFYSGRGILWVVGELGCGVLLLAVGNLARERHSWEAEGLDYASGLSAEVVLVSLLVAALVSLISMFGPLLTVERVSDWFWRTFREPSAQVEDTAERLFGGVSPPEGRADGAGAGLPPGASSYLPQSRLLGGRPNLLEEVVMVVWTDEPPPRFEEVPHEVAELVEQEPRHYWRGATTDYYSGRGWATTVEDRQEVQGELPLPAPPEYREVVQRYEFTAPHGDTLYALNAPARVEEPVEALWRIPPDPSSSVDSRGDLAGLASEVISYSVVSRVPTPTTEDLRAIPPLYAPEIRERYLQLPESVPQRVVDLAWEVVSEADTAYERARLLERYLRAYPYSLEVERPPEDRDVADYFLFDVREGYCDYYATAFVVMARAVGMPTRLASGYVGGQYDLGRGAYLVRQANGHSWPEVYFPGWGWIGFEPTASQTVTELPGEVVLPGEALPGPTGPPARVVRFRWRMAGLGVAALAGLGVAAWVGLRRRRRRAALVVTLPLVWDWVGQGGARLGRPPDPALTPREYAVVLSTDIDGLAKRTRRWNAHWVRLAVRGGAALAHLAALYGAQIYGARSVPSGDDPVASDVWARLRGPLRWFTWLGRLRRTGEWVTQRIGGRRLSLRGGVD